MPRLFVALFAPPAMANALVAAMGAVAGARWQSADQLHLTLSFLGDVGEERLADLDTALAAIHQSPIPLSCTGVGHFASKGRATTLWAAAQPADALGVLAAKVDRAVRAIGIIPQGMRFVPHITLARLGRSAGPIDGFLSANAALATLSAPIAAFGLYQSHLGPGGARYECLRDYRLRG